MTPHSADCDVHLDGCPLARPWLYDPDEWPLECICPDLVADEYGGVDPRVPILLNPEAVGDPDATPVVQLPPAMVVFFERTRCPECGLINQCHRPDCTRVAPPRAEGSHE